VREEVRAGLTHVLSDTPVRSGYMEAQAGVSKQTGAYVRAEAGLHPWKDVGVFGYGQLDNHDAVAGVGVRYTFGW
jgi:hypothetical protein